MPSHSAKISARDTATAGLTGRPRLIARAAAAPHVRTVVSVFAWVPPEVRRPVVSQLLAISRGHDRMGRMSETAGRQMREELLALARSQGDEVMARRLTKAL